MGEFDSEKWGELFSAYLDGELSAEDRAGVEAHLEHSTAARDLMAELDQAVRAVRPLPRRPAPPTILDYVTARVERDALLGPPDQPVTLNRHQQRPYRAVLAIAAVIVFAVGGALYVNLRLLDQQEPATGQVAMRTDALTDRSKGAPGAAGATAGAPLSVDPAAAPSPAPAREEPDREPALSFRRAAPGVAKKIETSPLPVESTGVFGVINMADADEAESTVETIGRDIVGAFAEGESPDAGPPRIAGRRGVDGTSAPEPTLETKLARQVPDSAIASHRFEVEPVQLRVAFSGLESQFAFESELAATFSATQYRLEAPGPLEAIKEKSTRAQAAPAPVRPSRVFLRGEPSRNFLQQRPHETQYLIQATPSETLELVERLASAGDDVREVQLQIGKVTANGPQGVRKIVMDVFPPAPASDVADDIDLVSVLQDLGLAPPSGPAGGWLGTGRLDQRRAGRGIDLARSADGAPTDEPSPPSEWITLVIDLVTQPHVPAMVNTTNNTPAAQP